MENISDILAKSFVIGINNKFNVNIYKKFKLIESKEMTYIELGQYLISNNQSIKIIDITLKKE